MKHLLTVLALSLAMPLSSRMQAQDAPDRGPADQEVTSLDSSSQDLVLSDFPTGLAQATGWVWEGFADTVMGGNSRLASPGIVNTPAGPAYRMTGQVVTKGGGFIQVRLDHPAGRFDASTYMGVEVVLDAPAGGSYYVFLRTKDNLFPWSYYGALLDLPGGKQTIRLPWNSFEAKSTLRRIIRTDRLLNVALVAAFKDFEPDLKIYRVNLYR
ncbi:MAG: CIA30 family protein [Spirochaetota bacterium]